MNLSTRIVSLTLRNPVITASGTCGYGEELSEVMEMERLGAIVTKTVTSQPRQGNPTPRVCETPAGMLNSIGLQNVGIEKFIETKVPFMRQFDLPLIANIAGDSVDDFAALAGKLNAVDGVAALELNLSCPNVAGGLDFSTNPALTRDVCAAVKAASPKLPIIAKLSPNVTDIIEIAQAAESGYADAISLINTIVGMAIDVERRTPRIASIRGGLSGPAIKPVALRMVYDVSQEVRIPVIGIGGILTAEDAIEFLMAGACAVQVGTATFTNPRAPLDILDGMICWMEQHGVEDISSLIGCVLTLTNS